MATDDIKVYTRLTPTLKQINFKNNFDSNKIDTYEIGAINFKYLQRFIPGLSFINLDDFMNCFLIEEEKTIKINNKKYKFVLIPTPEEHKLIYLYRLSIDCERGMFIFALLNDDDSPALETFNKRRDTHTYFAVDYEFGSLLASGTDMKIEQCKK